MGGGKPKINNQNNALSNSFGRIFEMFNNLHKSPRLSEQNEADSSNCMSDLTNTEKNDSKNMDVGDSGNINSLIALIAARFQQAQISPADLKDLSINDSIGSVSQSQPTSVLTMLNSLQQGTAEIRMNNPNLKIVAEELDKAGLSISTELVEQVVELINKFKLPEKQNLNGIPNILGDDIQPEFDTFRSVTGTEKGMETHKSRVEMDPLLKSVEESSVVKVTVSEKDQIPLMKPMEEPSSIHFNGDIALTEHLDEQTTVDTLGIMVNKQLHQPNKVYDEKKFVPPPVVPVSQFVPEVSEWIGGFFRSLPEQSGSTEARFSLIPEYLGSIQINITVEKGNVAAKIVTNTTLSKKAIEDQMSDLRQLLQQNGTPIQKLDIIYRPLQFVDSTLIDQSFLSTLSEKQSILSTVEGKEFQAPVLNQDEVSSVMETLENRVEKTSFSRHQVEQPTFDTSEVPVYQNLQHPDKMSVEKAFVPPPVVPVSQFVPEVSEWIGGFLRTIPEESGSTEARFALNPEHLGPIQIKITTEKGKVTAQIVTETSFAKEALEGQLPHLRQALQQHGILVQKLDITQQSVPSTDLSQTNSTFSQGGGSNSHEQRTLTSPQNGSKKQRDSNQKEMEKDMVISTYGVAGRMTASSVDFSA